MPAANNKGTMAKTINEETENLQEHINRVLKGFSHQEQADAYGVLSEFCNAMWLDETERARRMDMKTETVDEE